MPNSAIQSSPHTIPASHPALPGHFPGQPVTPGVVLLAHLAAAAHEHHLGEIRAIPRLKFMHPLGPGVAFCVEIDAPGQGGRRAFRIRAGTGDDTAFAGVPPVVFCAGQVILADPGA